MPIACPCFLNSFSDFLISMFCNFNDLFFISSLWMVYTFSYSVRPSKCNHQSPTIYTLIINSPISSPSALIVCYYNQLIVFSCFRLTKEQYNLIHVSKSHLQPPDPVCHKLESSLILFNLFCNVQISTLKFAVLTIQP